MTRNRISLTLEGVQENNGHLELSVFAEKIRHFLDLLNASVKEHGDKSVVFHVVRLSHSSPATIECEAIAEDMETVATAVRATGENLTCAEENTTQNLSHAVLFTME